MRIRIALKEAKESGYWLLLVEADARTEAQRQRLVDERKELVKILSTIYQKCR